MLNDKLFQYENQIELLKKENDEKNIMLNDLKNEKINKFKLEEKKELNEYKFKEMEKEKIFLKNQVEKNDNLSNNIYRENNENNILKEKLQNLENNKENLNKRIIQLEKENKDLIRRLSNQVNSKFLIPTKDVGFSQNNFQVNTNFC